MKEREGAGVSMRAFVIVRERLTKCVSVLHHKEKRASYPLLLEGEDTSQPHHCFPLNLHGYSWILTRAEVARPCVYVSARGRERERGRDREHV